MHQNYNESSIRVLGVYLRYHRLQQQHTLRSLAQIANISHTMISNIETGTVDANKETLRQLFEALHLTFYDNDEAPHDFYEIYDKIYDALYYCRFAEAKEFIDMLEEASDVYEHSLYVIDYQLIRFLYYNLTNTEGSNKEEVLKHYSSLLPFFNNIQTQLFHFVKGLNLLNQQQFHQSMLELEKALKNGDPTINPFINEYYVEVLARTYKWVDAMVIAKHSIRELEDNTNYIRAMHIRLQIGYINVIIKKIDTAYPLFKRVLQLGHQYDIPHLRHKSHQFMAFSYVKQNNFEKAKYHLKQIPHHFSADKDVIQMYVASMTKDKAIKEVYDEAIANPKVKKSKTYQLLVEVAYLSIDKDSLTYKKKLEELVEETKQTNDQEIMDVSHKMLMDYYQKKCQYKKAFKTAKELLQFKEFGL